MTEDEAVVLTRYVRAACPQQKFDEYTSDAWFDLLAEYSLDDCRRAVADVGKRQPFIAPSEIIDEVSKIRRARLEGFVYEPGDGDDDAKVYLARLREQRRQVANGEREPGIALRASGDQKRIKALLKGLDSVMPRPRA